MAHIILRLPAVKNVSGYSRSTIYLRIAQGLWTKQVSLGPRAVGWPSDEVAALNAARIASKSDDEIRSLVARLEAARKTLPLRLNQGSVETASQGEGECMLTKDKAAGLGTAAAQRNASHAHCTAFAKRRFIEGRLSFALRLHGRDR